jgi:hypothetical protein
MVFEIGKSALSKLAEFKASEQQDDPLRIKDIGCAQCSTLAALACQDEGMRTLFVKELLHLKTPQDRHAYLVEKGLTPLLDMMIPEKNL